MTAASFAPNAPTEPFEPTHVSFDNHYFKQNVENFKTRAGNLANQILFDSKEKDFDGPIVIRHHHYHYGPTFWTPLFYREPRVIIADPLSAREFRRQREDESNLALGIISTVVSFVFLYAIGTAYSRYEDASVENGDTEVFRKQIGFDRQFVQDPKEKSQMEEAVIAADLKGRICDRIENSAISDLAMRISGFIGAATLAVGAFFAVAPFVVTGTVVLVASLGAMILKWGLNSEDRHNRHDALLLQESLKRMNQL